jgi:hypothetical protein
MMCATIKISAPNTADVLSQVAEEYAVMNLGSSISCHVSHSLQIHVIGAGKFVYIWRALYNAHIPE